MKKNRKLCAAVSLLLVCIFMINPILAYGIKGEKTVDAAETEGRGEFGSITGEIKMPDGRAAEDIQILLYEQEDFREDDPDTAALETFSDEEGIYEIEDLQEGNYRLEFYLLEEDLDGALYEAAPAPEEADYLIVSEAEAEYVAYAELTLEAGQEFILDINLQEIQEETTSVSDSEIDGDMQDETNSIEDVSADELEAEDEELLRVDELQDLDENMAGAATETDVKLGVWESIARFVTGTTWTFDAYYVGESNQHHTDKTDDFSLKYQMEFHTSENLAIGNVEIRIPSVLLTEREGAAIRPGDIGVPAGTKNSPVESQYTPFNYYLDEETDELVFFNYKVITAGSNAAFQVLYKNLKIMEIVDETAWELKPTITVKTGSGTEVKETTPLTGTVNSEVILTKVTKNAYSYSGTSYTPGLYTRKQVEKYISGSLPSQFANNFDAYVFVVWEVSVTGSATQPWNLRIKDTATYPGGAGQTVGYIRKSDKYESINTTIIGSGKNSGYITGIDYNKSKEIDQSFYVVTAYPADKVPEGTVLSNTVDIALEPYDGKDGDQKKSASAVWSYKDYIWIYRGDITGIQKEAYKDQTVYKSWLEVYKQAAKNGKDTGALRYSTDSIIRGYGLTHITEKGSSKLGTYIPGTSYTATTVDDILYAHSSNDASNPDMMDTADYYFSSVSITQRDLGYDVWEDTTTAPDEAGDLKIYAMFAGKNVWEEVAVVPWDSSGIMTYTFSADDLAKEPWRVKAVHNTVNYSTTCNIGVTVTIRHDSPVFKKLLEGDPTSITVQNLSGIMGEYMKDGNLVSYVHDQGDENYLQYPKDLQDVTKGLYGRLIQRDSAQIETFELTPKAASYKTATAVNDAENGRVKVKYTLTAYDGYEVYSQGGANTLLSSGMRSPGRKEVVFYDLLPYGVQFDPSVEIIAGRTTKIDKDDKYRSITSYWDTSQVSVYVDSDNDILLNYNNTGRTLVCFHISYAGAESSFYSSFLEMWMEGWGVSFGTYYDWKNIDIVGETPNISAFMAAAGDDEPLLGQDGEVYRNNGVFPEVAGQKELYKDFGSNIANMGTQKTVLYAWSDAYENIALAAESGIEKKVRADADRFSEFGTSTTVEKGAGYTYEVTISNASGILEDIVITDRLEYAAEDRKGIESGFDPEWWYGTFDGLETKVLDELGIDYEIYYHADRMAAPVPTEGSSNLPSSVLVQSNGWYTRTAWQASGKSLSDVQAFAIDISKAKGGGKFQLAQMEYVSFRVKMIAPANVNPGQIYAYNNPSFYSRERETATGEWVHGDSVKVELASGRKLEVEKQFEGEIPDAVAGTRFEFTAYREIGNDKVKWANQEYYLYRWDEEADDWVREKELYGTDSNGRFYLYAGEKAVFLNVPGADKILFEETESPFWKQTIASDEDDGTTRKIVISNAYRPVLYARKNALYAPEGVVVSDYEFTFQLLVDGEPLRNTEFWYVDKVRTDGGIPNKDITKGTNGVGKTDSEGKFTIRSEDIIALPIPEVGAAYTLRETAGAGEGTDWFCTYDEYKGTVPVLGVSVMITNYYRWKDIYLTKKITNQDAEKCTQEFKFRLTDENGNPVTGNRWVLMKNGVDTSTNGFLTNNGEFSCACAGGVIRIEKLEAGKTYLIEETDSGTLYEALNGGLVEVTMPKYAESEQAEITNDYLKRPLRVSKLVLYDETDAAEAAKVAAKDFTMTAWVNGVLLANKQYQLYEGGTLKGTYTTNASGSFKLKHGQTAVFEEIGMKGDAYVVKETPDGEYEQVFPANGEDHSGKLNGTSDTVLFINGDNDGRMMIRKEYVGEDTAGQLAADALKTDTALRKNAAVTLTLRITPENGSTYIWPKTNTQVQVIDDITGGTVEVTWRAGSSIVLDPWKTIMLEDMDSTAKYSLSESKADQHWMLEWPEGSDSWYEVGQKTPESDQALNGIVEENPLAVIVNSLKKVDMDGSRIHKKMQASSQEVPTGAKLVWRLEEYDGSVWNPKAGISYLTFDDAGATCDQTLITGDDGRITLHKTDNGYPVVQFLKAVVKLNVNSGMAAGDLRLVEVLEESDGEWGYLSGYVNSEGEESLNMDPNDAVGFVNSNSVAEVEIEKVLEEDEGSSASTTFTFILEQVLAASADSVTNKSEILETQVRGGIAYTIHDSKTNELLGESVTTAKGEIIFKAGQYVRLQLPDRTLWTVREQVVLPYSLFEMRGSSGFDSQLVELEENLMLIQVEVQEVGRDLKREIESKGEFGEIDLGGNTWIILSIDDNKGTAELLSKDYVGHIQYHNNVTNWSWEESDIRFWLNKDYFDSLDTELTDILINVEKETELPKSSATKIIEEAIYLLSADEFRVYAPAFQAVKGKNQYLSKYGITEPVTNVNGWWLRSPRTNMDSTAYSIPTFNSTNEVNASILVTELRYVRPALTIQYMDPDEEEKGISRVVFENKKEAGAHLYVTKTVESADERYPAPDDAVFTFALKLNESLASYHEYRVFNENGDEVYLYADGEFTEDKAGKIPYTTDFSGTFTLRAGQTALFEYVGVGTGYEVTEFPTEDFEQILPAGGEAAVGTVTEEGASVVFTNLYIPSSENPMTKIIISKGIAFPVGYEIPEAPEFSFIIKLKNKAYAMEDYIITDTLTGLQTGTGTTDQNGRFTLRIGETATFEGIETNIDYEIREEKEEGWWVVGDTTHEGATQAPQTLINYTNASAAFGVTKTLSDNTTPDDVEFTFQLSNGMNTAIAGAKYLLYWTNGTRVDEVEYETSETGTFTLKPGQTAIFFGIEPGTVYNVSEEANPEYIQKVPLNANGYIGKEVTNVVEILPFVNEPIPEDLRVLTVTKIVESEAGDVPDEEDIFTFQLMELGADGSTYTAVADAVYSIAVGSSTLSYQTDAEGKFTLKRNETARFEYLKGGSTYRVQEVDWNHLAGKYYIDEKVKEGVLETQLQFIFTNVYKTRGINLYIHKQGNGEKALAGAEFDLYTDVELTDKVNENKLVSDDQGGVTITGLPVGTYYLVETKSPAGYQLLANPIEIEFIRDNDGLYAVIDGKEYRTTDSDEPIYIEKEGTGNEGVHLTIVNKKGFGLPISGGAGIVLLLVLVLSGIAVLSGAHLRNERLVAAKKRIIITLMK